MFTQKLQLTVLSIFVPLIIPEFNCTFDDSHLCGWTQSAVEDYALSLNSGKTPSDGTGPLYDHTTGGMCNAYEQLPQKSTVCFQNF